jgi:Flp pilus assembly protein protease CpaA
MFSGYPLLKISDPVAVALVIVGAGIGALVDLKTRRVPNPLTMGLALTGVALAFAHATTLGVSASLAGLGIGLALMLPAHMIGATGAGDVKLFAAIGTLLGPIGIVMAFLYTAIAGGVIAVVVALSRRRLAFTIERTAALMNGGANSQQIESISENNRFAYAPAIAAGALIAALGL